MGYFANGSEGESYLYAVCSDCVNWRETALGMEDWGCPVMDLHLIYNYKQFDDKTIKDFLETFIPTKDGCNEKCKMFIESALAQVKGQLTLEDV
jgi:hypothetical protein